MVPVLIHVCGRYLLLSTLVECGAGRQVGSLRARLKHSVRTGLQLSARTYTWHTASRMQI